MNYTLYYDKLDDEKGKIVCVSPIEIAEMSSKNKISIDPDLGKKFIEGKAVPHKWYVDLKEKPKPVEIKEEKVQHVYAMDKFRFVSDGSLENSSLYIEYDKTNKTFTIQKGKLYDDEDIDNQYVLDFFVTKSNYPYHVFFTFSYSSEEANADVVKVIENVNGVPNKFFIYSIHLFNNMKFGIKK